MCGHIGRPHAPWTQTQESVADMNMYMSHHTTSSHHQDIILHRERRPPMLVDDCMYQPHEPEYYDVMRRLQRDGDRVPPQDEPVYCVMMSFVIL